VKNIKPPKFNDFKMLRNISNNSKLSSHPELKGKRHAVVKQYVKYIRSGGDAFGLNPSVIADDNLKGSLIAHYTGEIKGLEIISYIRDKLSPSVCPMCGGKHPTTVDHLIPKDVYPEYAFFIKNLVPACSCNNKRGGRNYIGKNNGERVFHPYFDNELSQVRLIKAKVEPPFESPKISLFACCDDQKLLIPAKYHLDNVVSKTNVLSVLNDEWRSLIRLYHIHFEIVPSSSVSFDIIENKLIGLLHKEDAISGTPNNWSSMLLAGILSNPDAVQFLVNKFKRFQQGIDYPEDY
jgi:hypothetical protein